MPDVTVVRTYLEMRSPDDVRTGDTPPPSASVEREDPCPIPVYRELYDRVGRNHFWRDRLTWTDDELRTYLSRDDVSVWVMRDSGALAGYFELVRQPDMSVEIVYFGLVPEAIGRGLGKLLLTRAVQEGWRLHPNRVWLHTCTLDGPAALPNYLARGFTPFKKETYTTAI